MAGAQNTMKQADTAPDSKAVFLCPYAGAVRLCRESANTIPARGISGRGLFHVLSSRRQGRPLASGLKSRKQEQDMQSDKITRRAALGAAGGALALSVTTMPAIAKATPHDPVVDLEAVIRSEIDALKTALDNLAIDMRTQDPATTNCVTWETLNHFASEIETALHGAPIRRSVSGMAVACEPRHVTRMTAEEQSKIFAEMDPTYVHLGRDA